MATPAQKPDQNLPTVVLVGRANVGKSTLFNTLIEDHKALVSDIAGTTRTNNEGVILWRGKYVHVIDTGGLDSIAHKETEQFDEEIQGQAELALASADLVLFVTDVKGDILPQEKKLAKTLKKEKNGPAILLVANKTDSTKILNAAPLKELSRLALGEPHFISAANGRGVGDLLDVVYKHLQKGKVRPKIHSQKQMDEIRVSLVGKPNVGKSSLFNKLIGEDKVIVSPVAHTTRESFDTRVVYERGKKKRAITFVDTAGIRRKAKVKGNLERGGIQKSLKSIEKSQIVLIVIDGSEPISSQDLQLGGLVEKRSKSVIILVNKWDLAEDNSQENRSHVEAVVRSHFPHLKFAPILFVSGKTGYRVHNIFPLLLQVAQGRSTEIPRRTIDRFLDRITKEHLPSRGKGTRFPKILGMKQVTSNPPIFELFIKSKTSLHRSYLRYIENKLREYYDFTGTPIVIKITKMRR